MNSVSTYNGTTERERALPPILPTSKIKRILDGQVLRFLDAERQRAAFIHELDARGLPSHDLRFAPPPAAPAIPQGWEIDHLAAALAARAEHDDGWRAGHEQRAHVRALVAEYLERVVIPATADPKLQQLPGKLMRARWSAEAYYSPFEDAWLHMWDTKASCPLLCPDDGRDEGARYRRRYMETLMQWRTDGRRIYSMVLTVPNVAPGKLQEGMRNALRDAKYFIKRIAGIKGALYVVEAPLSWRRDWNVHVNVLCVADGYLDWKVLRKRWSWQANFRAIQGEYEDVHATLRELLKYPAQAVASKSEEHAHRAARSAPRFDGDEAPPAPPPPLTQWTADEFLEFWHAHKRFRRARSTGELYRVGKPPKQSMAGFVPIAWLCMFRGRVYMRSALLESIQCDKWGGSCVPRLSFESIGVEPRGPPSTGPP